ncbi:hypothetical protein SDC9_201045 [bioreactor metagenome]|uniref:Uncharacterized protein n=1 Tax=bioreactor metagenome TaxID=1076179 RepID=A0A645IPX5_9ZZZZ
MAHLGIGHANHGTNNLTRCKELTTIIAFFTHLEQQPFIYLAEREDVRITDIALFDIINLVENVQKILFCVHTCFFYTGHNLCNDLLSGIRIRDISEVFQMRYQVIINEGKVLAKSTLYKLFTLCAFFVSPVTPAVGIF